MLYKAIGPTGFGYMAAAEKGGEVSGGGDASAGDGGGFEQEIDYCL